MRRNSATQVCDLLEEQPVERVAWNRALSRHQNAVPASAVDRQATGHGDGALQAVADSGGCNISSYVRTLAQPVTSLTDGAHEEDTMTKGTRTERPRAAGKLLRQSSVESSDSSSTRRQHSLVSPWWRFGLIH